MCPNCRAVTDLEADVDEIEQWEEEADNVSITDDAQLDEANGAPVHPDRASTPEDDDMALASATQQLSLGGVSQTQPVAIPGALLATSNAISGSEGSSVDGFQPGPSRHRTASSTPESMDQPRSARDKRQAAALSRHILDGPLTPENTAGPYVFDGAAGRARGISAALAADETVVAGV